MQAGLALIGLFVVVPMWGLVYLAFDGSIKSKPMHFRIWPEQFTTAIFNDMWQQPYQTVSFIALLQNSLIVSFGAAILSVMFGASMAYAFARYRFPGQRIGLFGLLGGALLPPVALMTPLYILLSMLKLRNSLFGLIIVYTALAMPFCIWNMRAAFQAIPLELEESAFLDGATPFWTFIYITLPLAMPSLAVAGLIAFLVGYSEFVMGWLFVTTSDNVTLAMAISAMMGGAPWNRLAALAIMMSAPVVVLFLLLQRYLLDRLLIGGVE